MQTHLLTTYCNTDPALPKETPASFREKSKHSFWKQRPKHYTWQAHGCWSSFLQQANQTAYSQHDQFWLEEIWKLCQQVRWAQELKKKINKWEDRFGCQHTHQQSHSSVLLHLQADCFTWASLLYCSSHRWEGCLPSVQALMLPQLWAGKRWAATAPKAQTGVCYGAAWGKLHTAILLPVCSEHAWGESSIHLTRNHSTEEWAEKTWMPGRAFVVDSRKKGFWENSILKNCHSLFGGQREGAAVSRTSLLQCLALCKQ